MALAASQAILRFTNPALYAANQAKAANQGLQSQIDALTASQAAAVAPPPYVPPSEPDFIAALPQQQQVAANFANNPTAGGSPTDSLNALYGGAPINYGAPSLSAAIEQPRGPAFRGFEGGSPTPNPFDIGTPSPAPEQAGANPGQVDFKAMLGTLLGGQ